MLKNGRRLPRIQQFFDACFRQLKFLGHDIGVHINKYTNTWGFADCARIVANTCGNKAGISCTQAFYSVSKYKDATALQTNADFCTVMVMKRADFLSGEDDLLRVCINKSLV